MAEPFQIAELKRSCSGMKILADGMFVFWILVAVKSLFNHHSTNKTYKKQSSFRRVRGMSITAKRHLEVLKKSPGLPWRQLPFDPVWTNPDAFWGIFNKKELREIVS